MRIRCTHRASSRPLAAIISNLRCRARAGAALTALVLAGLPLIAYAQAETHAEYTLTHDELVGGATVAHSDVDPGRSEAASISMTGNIAATWGQLDVRMEGSVVAGDANEVKLRTEAEHAFSLGGTDRDNDVWLGTDSDLLVRAELVDVLTLQNVPAGAATLELYWRIRGQVDGEIAITGSGDLWFDFDTWVRLENRTSAPHSGGSLHVESTSWGGYLASTFDEAQTVDTWVTMTFDVDPTVDIDIEAMLELEVDSALTNGVEYRTLQTDGLHRAAYVDHGAELVGVIVRDGLGNILPDALIVSQSGYDYPVEDVVPGPPPPDDVILSPVAVIDTDLGEQSAAPLIQMIDGSGLDVPFVSGVDGFDEYLAEPNAIYQDASYLYNWQSAVYGPLPLQGYVDFDLGETYTIDRLALWNISLDEFRVQIADDPAGPWTEIGQYDLPSQIWSYSSVVEVLDLGGEHDTRYLRLAIDSAHKSASYYTFAYATIGEVAVSAKPVPEPELGLLAGFGVLSVFTLSHRRKQRTPTAEARPRPRHSDCAMSLMAGDWLGNEMRRRRRRELD